MTLLELLNDVESPQVTAALESMPKDVQAVVADFKADYRKALANLKESYVSMFSWALEAQNQLLLLRSYLETEKLRAELESAAPPRENPAQGEAS